MVQRGERHPGAQSDPLGGGRERGEEQQRRGQVAVRETVVLADPERVEPRLFGGRPEREGVAVRRPARARWLLAGEQAQADGAPAGHQLAIQPPSTGSSTPLT
jgi:hypothetical protein